MHNCVLFAVTHIYSVWQGLVHTAKALKAANHS